MTALKYREAVLQFQRDVVRVLNLILVELKLWNQKGDYREKENHQKGQENRKETQS